MMCVCGISISLQEAASSWSGTTGFTWFLQRQKFCSLCGTKRSHIFKFCEHLLKASNTMTRFGSRSSNSCYFTPKTPPETISEGLKSKIFIGGGHAPRPTLRVLYYISPSKVIKCTLEAPLSKSSIRHWSTSLQEAAGWLRVPPGKMTQGTCVNQTNKRIHIVTYHMARKFGWELNLVDCPI